MKSGLTLDQMALELQRRQDVKRDFIADTRQLVVMTSSADAKGVPFLSMELPKTETPITLALGETFRKQMAGHFKVPTDYAERIVTAYPALYADTFNTFLGAQPSRQMIRTLDARARAFLSDRFRTLDDYDLVEAVLPEIHKHKDIRIESSQFTESRFYLKAVFPRIETEVKVGDPVQIGLVVSNSEVGAGALQVLPMVYRLICKNGMTSSDYGQRRYHVGKRASAEEAAFELYSDDTRRLDDAAFFAKVRDTVRGVLTREVLEALTQKMRDATEQKLEGTNIQAAVEVTARKFGYGERTAGGILRHLIEGHDLTRYGLMNAITRQSQDEADYDLATRMEMDGARIVELPKQDWKAIGEAALAKAA
jgi:Domain of unknown function (DUF932)